MNYKLAKKLKEAGFPRRWIDGRYFYLGDGTKILFDRIKHGTDERGFVIDYDKTLTYIPTLEELIEACGDSFGCLDRSRILPGKWLAPEKEMPGFTGEGDTPAEAVANLWLALNKK